MIDNASAFTGAPLCNLQIGELFINPFMDVTEAWFIVSGIVRQYEILGNGSQFSLNLYKPGSVLALTWLLGNSPNRYYFEALTAVSIKKIPADTYRAYLENHPDLALLTLKRLSAGLDGIFSRLASNSRNDAETRILNEIRIDQLRFNQTKSVGLTSVILSNRTGLARETVSRCLRKLASDGLIVSNEQGIHLTNS